MVLEPVSEAPGPISHAVLCHRSGSGAGRGLPLRGGLSERLWRDCEPLALECLHHPFVQALATGSLDRACFQHYVLQDAFFLSYYAQAYSAALDRCGGNPQPGSAAAAAAPVMRALLEAVDHELHLHASYAAGWGVDVSMAGSNVTPSAATSAYTDYLMDVADDPQASIAEVLAAMIPCSRLYGFLGCSLAAAHGNRNSSNSSSSPYWSWVETYSGDDYLTAPDMKEALFDKIAVGIPYGARQQQLLQWLLPLGSIHCAASAAPTAMLAAQRHHWLLSRLRPVAVAVAPASVAGPCGGMRWAGACAAIAAAAATPIAVARRSPVYWTNSERLKTLYARAMELEVNFFSAQPHDPPSRPLGLLVCDFDDTLTQGDTIRLILDAAVDARVRVAPQGEAEALRTELQARVAALASNYATQHAELLARLLLPAAAAAAVQPSQQPQNEQQRCTSEASYNGVGLDAFCDALSDFDEQMNAVVVQDGILAGLTPRDLMAAADGARLRDGAATTLMRVRSAGVPLSILSVNWSTTLVRAVLDEALHRSGSDHPQQQQQQQQRVAAADAALDIVANELTLGPDGVSTTGGINTVVQHGRDKRAALTRLVAQHAPLQGPVVFVGDSPSDIPALLLADYGIVMGSSTTLRRVLRTFGVRLLPLAAATPSPPGQHSNSSSCRAPELYEASDWHEVAAFLLGPRTYPGGGAAGMSAAAAALVHVSTGSGSTLKESDTAAAASGAGAAATAAASLRAWTAGVAAAPPPPMALTIAGSDSGGGAGIQADLKAMMAGGCFGTSVLTALTAQNSRGVQLVSEVAPDMLQAQLDSVLTDLPPAAVKTGMLPSAAAVQAVAAALTQHARAAAARGEPAPPLVVDPVMISTSGHSLADGSVGAAIVQHLLPLATLITPNLPEAQALTGSGPITDLEGMKAAALALHRLGARAVLVKGGHLTAQQQHEAAAGSGCGSGGIMLQAVDVLYDGATFHQLSAPWVDTANTHGTGCTLAAAAAAALARGAGIVAAVAEAKAYLTRALAGSAHLELGAGPQRPFHHGAGYAQSATAPVAGSQLALDYTERARSVRTAAHKPNQLDLRLYVVTDAACNARAGRSLEAAVAAAVAGGATVVQLRDKDADGGEMLAAARALIQICRPAGVPVIINDRIDVAIASSADGVHIGQSDLPARVARALLGPHALLGVSVKTPAEAAKARADGADYVGVGAVFPTGTKDASVIGLEGLAAAVAGGALPAVAIGGVGAANAAQVVSAGVDGLAVVSAVFAAADPEAATRELLAAVDAALSTRKSSSSNAPASPHQGSADNIDHSEEDHQRIAACA